MEKKEFKEPSKFDIEKQGFDDDLENLKKQIEDEVRSEKKQENRGRGDVNRNIANWMLRSFPYGSYAARDQAYANDEAAQKLKEQRIQEEIEKRLAEKQRILEQNIFGESLKAAQAREQARQEREARIVAFNERTLKKQGAEKGRVAEKEKEPEDDKPKGIDVRNTNQASIKRDEDYTSAEKSDILSGSNDYAQDKAARLEEIKSRIGNEFDRAKEKRDRGNGIDR